MPSRNMINKVSLHQWISTTTTIRLDCHCNVLTFWGQPLPKLEHLDSRNRVWLIADRVRALACDFPTWSANGWWSQPGASCPRVSVRRRGHEGISGSPLLVWIGLLREQFGWLCSLSWRGAGAGNVSPFDSNLLQEARPRPSSCDDWSHHPSERPGQEDGRKFVRVVPNSWENGKGRWKNHGAGGHRDLQWEPRSGLPWRQWWVKGPYFAPTRATIFPRSRPKRPGLSMILTAIAREILMRLKMWTRNFDISIKFWSSNSSRASARQRQEREKKGGQEAAAKRNHHGMKTLKILQAPYIYIYIYICVCVCACVYIYIYVCYIFI